MKRVFRVIVASLLAVVVVYLGAGTVVVECMRSNTVSIGYDDDGCCKEMPSTDGAQSCMKTTVLKLQPTLLSQQVVNFQPPVLSLLPLFCSYFLPQNTVFVSPFGQLSAVTTPHAPPRLYRSLIQVFLI